MTSRCPWGLFWFFTDVLSVESKWIDKYDRNLLVVFNKRCRWSRHGYKSSIDSCKLWAGTPKMEPLLMPNRKHLTFGRHNTVEFVYLWTRPPWSQIDIHTPCVFNLFNPLTGSLLFLLRLLLAKGHWWNDFSNFYLTIKSNKEILLCQDVFGGLLFAAGPYQIWQASIFNWLIVFLW